MGYAFEIDFKSKSSLSLPLFDDVMVTGVPAGFFMGLPLLFIALPAAFLGSGSGFGAVPLLREPKVLMGPKLLPDVCFCMLVDEEEEGEEEEEEGEGGGMYDEPDLERLDKGEGVEAGEEGVAAEEVGGSEGEA